MKLFSTEITTSGGGKIAKAVLLRKNRKGYSLLQNYITEPENLKSVSGNHITYFSIDYFDTIIETLNVPPVKDSKTFKLLAGNKLKDHMQEDTSYLMAYKTVKTAGKNKSGNVEHRVYMIPEKLFEEDAGLSESQKLKMNLFTLSDIAVIGVSNFFFPEDTVFHAYADEFKVFITVSRGSNIIYSRTLEYEAVAGQTPESVFYENINLTYMFVTKNMGVKVERIILAGLLKDMANLSAMLFEFNGIAQSVIITHELIPNCSRDTFHQFMIPISLCLLEDSYDFTPDKYKERRGFNLLKKYMNIAAFIAVLVLAYMNLGAGEQLSSAKQRLSSQTKTAELKLKRYVRNFDDSAERKFGFYYLRQLEKRNSGALELYPDVAGLIEAADFENVTFAVGNDGARINISGDVQLAGFKDVDGIRRKVDSYLGRIKNGGRYKVSDTSRYDMERLSADIRIELAAKAGE